MYLKISTPAKQPNLYTYNILYKKNMDVASKYDVLFYLIKYRMMFKVRSVCAMHVMYINLYSFVYRSQPH